MNLDQIAPRVGFRDPRRYREVAGFMFDRIPIAGRRVLDVGCGLGALSVWAALQGASSVLALEPELGGSTRGSADALESVIEDFRLHDRIELRRMPLAELDGTAGFDLAILDAVVNHLDEAAAPRLHYDPLAVDAYAATLRPLRSLVRPGAFVVVADCGRRSLWNTIGREGPWTHDIGWEKHQQPQTWIDVFRRAGFEPHDVRWSPLSRTGRLTGNRFVQYFTMAHFVLRLRAV